MSKYFLGVDGGQSSTTAVIGDAHGRIVGWGSAGPCNHVAAAEAKEKFRRVMRECLSHAAIKAGMETSGGKWKFHAACLGMSGGPADKAALLGELIAAEHLIVTDDARIALAGATAGDPGIVAIAGTGSIAFGENASGETARAGGWGYVFGDEGSAFDIVRQALRAVVREHEGWGVRTALMPALIEAADGAADANELLHRFYTPEWPRQRVAGLAPIVNRIAEEGDPVARGILENAARELAMFVGAVRRQLWAESEVVRIAWVGGVFQSALLLERFRALVTLEDGVVFAPPQHGPAVGGLVLAYRVAETPLPAVFPATL